MKIEKEDKIEVESRIKVPVELDRSLQSEIIQRPSPFKG